MSRAQPRILCLALLLPFAGSSSAAEPLTLKGHTGWVAGVAFSPDGKQLATASADTTVKFWDATTGKELAALEAHGDAVTAVAFSADGTMLATSSFDGTAKVWDATNRKLLHTLRGHRGAVQTVAFDPHDGRFLATGGIDGTVRVWDIESGTERSTDPHKSWVNAVAFRPTKQGWIASVSSDNTICFRGHTDAKVGMLVRPRAAELRSVAFSPDGKLVAAGTRYGSVKVWDMKGDEVATLKGHTADVWAVAFSHDGATLATGNGDWDRPGDVRLWDTTTWKERARLKHTGEVLCLAFSPKKSLLAAGSWDKTVKLWDIAALPGKPNP